MNLNKIFGTAGIVAVCIATWITLSDQPIAQKINLWQADMMDDNKYFPALTIFVLVLPVLLILLLAKMYFLKREKKP